MDLDNYNALSIDLAEELGEECTLLSLPIRSDFYKVASSLISHIGLRDEKNKALAVPIRPDETGSYCDDYYCRKFMGLTKSDGQKHDVFSDLIKSFDKTLKYDSWRRIGTENRRFTEAQAEIFICCSAFAHDRTLKQHVAVFLQYCRREGIALNSVEPYRLEIGRLINEELEKFTYDNKSHKKSNEPNGSFFNEQRLENHISNQEKELVKSEIGNIRKFLDVYPYNKSRLENPGPEKRNKALIDVDTALQRFPDNVDLLALKFALMSGTGLITDILPLSEKLYLENPSNENSVITYTNCLSKSHKHIEALNICENFVKDSPYCIRAHLSIAGYHQKMERIHEAIEAYKLIISMDGEILSPYIELSKCYERILEHGKGEAVLRKALIIYPESFEVRSNLASCLALQGKSDESRKMAFEACRLSKGFVEKIMLEALDDLDRGDFLQARDKIRIWVNSIEKNPLSSPREIAFHMQVLGSAVDENESAEVVLRFQRECFRESLKLDPNSLGATAGLIAVDINSADLDSAREAFHKAKNTLKGQNSLLNLCQNICLNVKTPDLKELPFEWYLDDHPEDINTQIRIAYIYISRRQEEKSRKRLEVLKTAFEGVSHKHDGTAVFAKYAFSCAQVFHDFGALFPLEIGTIDFLRGIFSQYITDDLLIFDRDLYIRFLELRFDTFYVYSDRNVTQSNLIDSITLGEKYLAYIPKHRQFERWVDVATKISHLYCRVFEMEDKYEHIEQSINILKNVGETSAFEGTAVQSISSDYFSVFLRPLRAPGVRFRQVEDQEILLEYVRSLKALLNGAHDDSGHERWAEASIELGSALTELCKVTDNSNLASETEELFSSVLNSKIVELYDHAIYGICDIQNILLERNWDESKALEFVELLEGLHCFFKAKKNDRLVSACRSEKGFFLMEAGMKSSKPEHLYKAIQEYQFVMSIDYNKFNRAFIRLCHYRIGYCFGNAYDFSSDKKVQDVESAISSFELSLRHSSIEDTKNMYWCNYYLAISHVYLGEEYESGKHYAEAIEYVSTCKSLCGNDSERMESLDKMSNEMVKKMEALNI